MHGINSGSRYFDGRNNTSSGGAPSQPIWRKPLALLAPSVASLLFATTAHAANETAVKEIVAFEQGLAAATTPETIAAGFAEGARQYDPAAKAPSIGRAAILAHLSEQMAQVKSLTGEIVHIWADADPEGVVGYDVSEQKGVLTMNDGKTTNFHIWATHVLRRYDGKWKVLLEQVTYLP